MELLSFHFTFILKFLFIPIYLICLIPKEFPGVNNEKSISLANGANKPLLVISSSSIYISISVALDLPLFEIISFSFIYETVITAELLFSYF